MIATYKIHGNISSINCIRTTTNVGLLGMDSLLLSFKDAKVFFFFFFFFVKLIISFIYLLNINIYIYII